MIKTEKAYQEAVKRLDNDIKVITEQKRRLQEMALTPEQVKKAIEPLLSFHEQLKEEVAYYEKIKRGEFEPIINLKNFGKTLIAYRIYKNISQKELAERLNVSESQISRDEKNEYYGATIERIQKVMEALGMIAKTKVNPTAEELISA